MFEGTGAVKDGLPIAWPYLTAVGGGMATAITTLFSLWRASEAEAKKREAEHRQEILNLDKEHRLEVNKLHEEMFRRNEDSKKEVVETYKATVTTFQGFQGSLEALTGVVERQVEEGEREWENFGKESNNRWKGIETKLSLILRKVKPGTE